MSRRPPALLAALLGLVALSCGTDSSTLSPRFGRPDAGLKPRDNLGRIAFLGNSLTYTNALVVVVDSLASSSGIRSFSLEIAVGGAGLVDLYRNEGYRRLIRTGGFSYVVMQQGPSSLPESRDSLLSWVKLWEPVIREGGARPGLYAVWPEKERSNVFPDVSESYRLAAEEIDGLFFPVGDTWLEIWKRKPDAPLYGRDDFHPSTTGTYAAAVVILSVLSNRRPTSLSPVVPGISGAIDSTLAATIRESAETVLRRRGVRWAE